MLSALRRAEPDAGSASAPLGASGFLVKSMALEDILGAIRVVAAGEALLAPSVTKRLIGDFVDRSAPAEPRPARGLDGVTGREREVLGQIGKCACPLTCAVTQRTSLNASIPAWPPKRP
jgi:DNA-binding NarL/FixJ family response regulator